MILILTYVHQLETLYLCYGVKCHYGVIWGHGSHRVIFSKNAITRSCCIYSMTIRLKHVHQLETFYLCYGVNGQSWVI